MVIPSTKNAPILKSFIQVAGSGKLEIVFNGDSNGLFGGYGYDHGWQAAMLGLGYLMHAHGVHALAENGGSSQGVGYANNEDSFIKLRSTSGVSNAAAAMPTVFSNLWDDSLDPQGAEGTLSKNHIRHSFALFGDGVAKEFGMSFGPNNPLGYGADVSTRLVHEARIGYFNTADGGVDGHTVQFRWFDDGAFISGSSVTTVIGGSDPTGPLIVQCELPIGSYGTSIECRQQSHAGTTTIDDYPYWGDFQRTHNPAIAQGFSVSTYYSVGSADIEDAAQYLEDTRLSSYMGFLTRRQEASGQDPLALFVLTYGTNNNAGAMTGAEYKVFAKRCIDAIEAAWVANGNTLTRLHILLMPSHTESEDDAKIAPYRQAAYELADESGGGVSYIDLSVAVPFATLNSQADTPRFDSGGADTNHLDTISLESDSYTRVVAAALDLALNAVEGDPPVEPPKAIFISNGDAVTLSWPSLVDAGEIVAIDELLAVSARYTPTNEVASLRVRGVFDVVKDGLSEFSVGDEVYWDFSGRVAHAASSSASKYFGVAIENVGVDATHVRTLMK